MSIDTVEEIPDYKTGERVLYGYVVWNNGRKSQHPLRVINNKCPQKVCCFAKISNPFGMELTILHRCFGITNNICKHHI